MLPIRVSLTLPSGSTTGIAAAQTPSGAGNLILNGSYVTSSVAYMPSGVSRRVLLTFAADETGHTFTLYGTARGGQAQSEIISGTTAGTVQSSLDYKTVTRIAISAAATGNVSAGTNGAASTRWVYVSPHMTPFNLSIATDVTGTVNYTVEVCYDDPAGQPQDFVARGPLAVTTYPDSNLDGSTADGRTTYDAPITAWRVRLNSGDGNIVAIGTQAGISGP